MLENCYTDGEWYRSVQLLLSRYINNPLSQASCDFQAVRTNLVFCSRHVVIPIASLLSDLLSGFRSVASLKGVYANG